MDLGIPATDKSRYRCRGSILDAMYPLSVEVEVVSLSLLAVFGTGFLDASRCTVDWMLSWTVGSSPRSSLSMDTVEL